MSLAQKWPPSSPDANPLDFSFWSQLARAIKNKSVPKNREDLIRRLEGTWHQVLEPNYVEKTCLPAWDKLRRIVAVDGGYIERIRTPKINDNCDVDQNNNNML